jgi:hypothetical protein
VQRSAIAGVAVMVHPVRGAPHSMVWVFDHIGGAEATHERGREVQAIHREGLLEPLKQ